MSQQTYPGHSPVQSKPEPKEVNPVTQKRYKRQAWWQVTFPVIVVAVIVVALLVLLAVLGGPPALSVVADFSLALLCLLAALPVLAVFAIFGALVFLMTKALGKTPPYTYKAHQFIGNVYRWADDVTDRIANAIIEARIRMNGVSAGLEDIGIEMDIPDEPEGGQRIV